MGCSSPVLPKPFNLSTSHRLVVSLGVGFCFQYSASANLRDVAGVCFMGVKAVHSPAVRIRTEILDESCRARGKGQFRIFSAFFFTSFCCSEQVCVCLPASSGAQAQE